MLSEVLSFPEFPTAPIIKTGPGGRRTTRIRKSNQEVATLLLADATSPRPHNLERGRRATACSPSILKRRAMDRSLEIGLQT